MTRIAPAGFRANLLRGRRFEAEERAGWGHVAKQHIRLEAPTTWASKHGRIDIKIDEDDGSVAIVEIKATDWNALPSTRIRATAQRHARQVWRYVNDHVESQGKDVCAGIVYEHEPRLRAVRLLVEQLLNDRCLQVVWRKERSRASSKRRRTEKEPYNNTPNADARKSSARRLA